jgi:hypothetical protein
MRHEVTTRRVLYEIAGMRAIEGKDDEFPGAGGVKLPMRRYATTPSPELRSAVVIVEGYPDAGFAERLGCRFMDMEWSISLAQLIAASGLTAVTHSNRTPAPDAIALMKHLASQGFRLAVWGTSGHGPVAMAAMEHAACGVLTNPIVDDTVVTKPLYLVRSGRDETPGLNAALDQFVSDALAANRPLTLVNHPEAPHSFELNHHSTLTRSVLRHALAFLRFHLGVEIH